MIHTSTSGTDNPAAQAHHFKAFDHKHGGKLEYNPESIDKIQEHIKYDAMKSYITKYDKINPDKSNYLYSLYLENLTPEIREKCIEIKNLLGVKIFIDNTIPNQIKFLDDMKSELMIWKDAGFKIPVVIDEFDVDIPYLSYESQGMFANAITNKEQLTMSVSHRNIKASNADTKKLIRHELFHLNDPNFEITIWDSKDPIHSEILANKEKFSEYLRKAGLRDIEIQYAFSMPREFAPVALQGNVNTYPQEFKALLIKMGVAAQMLND